MRDVLFRGKRIDNGEWVCGYLICSNDHKRAFIGDLDFDLPERDFVSVDELDVVEVDLNTVDQYTGITDTCGTTIFENDICRFDNEEPRSEDRFTNYAIQWDRVNCRFIVVDAENCEYVLDEFFSKFAVVIGNIHDNSELMGGAQ